MEIDYHLVLLKLKQIIILTCTKAIGNNFTNQTTNKIEIIQLFIKMTILLRLDFYLITMCR